MDLDLALNVQDAIREIISETLQMQGQANYPFMILDYYLPETRRQVGSKHLVVTFFGVEAEIGQLQV